MPDPNHPNPPEPGNAPAERPRPPVGRVARLVGGRRRPVTVVVLVAVALVGVVLVWGGQDGGDGGDVSGGGGRDGDRASGRPEGPGTAAASGRTTSASSARSPGSSPVADAGRGGSGTTPATGGSGATGPRPAAPGDLLLAADGLGVVELGAPAAEVVPVLTASLGPPDDDTGLVDPSEGQVLGACPAGRQRAVRWGLLTVGFVEGPSAYSRGGTEHLLMYSYGSPEGSDPAGPLATATGVSLGSTVDEVRRAYGDAARVVPGDEIVEPYVEVDVGGPHPLVMPSPGDRVSMIRAGEPCT